jgi:hypothetical protein
VLLAIVSLLHLQFAVVFVVKLRLNLTVSADACRAGDPGHLVLASMRWRSFCVC